MSVTNIVVKDPEMLAQLAAANGPILFRGPNGECIRWAQSVPAGQMPANLRPPISEEEYEELRQQPDSGIPLAEFWKQVERGEWQ